MGSVIGRHNTHHAHPNHIARLTALGAGWEVIAEYANDKSARGNEYYIRRVARAAGLAVEIRRAGTRVEARNPRAVDLPATVAIVERLERGEPVGAEDRSLLAAVHRLLADFWVRHYADGPDCRCHAGREETG